MSLSNRMARMEGVVYGNEDAAIPGLGHTLKEVREEVAALRRIVERLIWQGVGAAAVLWLVLPPIAEAIKKKLGL